MLDEDFCIRCAKIGMSFYKSNMLSLMDDMDADVNAKKSAETCEQWDLADKNLQKQEEGEELAYGDGFEHIETCIRSGYRTRMLYGFLTPTEFSNEFGVNLKAIPVLKQITRYNEDGSRKLQGLAFKLSPGDEYRFRVLEQFFEASDYKVLSLLKPSDRLRQKQPEETLQRLFKDSAVDNPAAFF
jgi:hypothetical protein